MKKNIKKIISSFLIVACIGSNMPVAIAKAQSSDFNIADAAEELLSIALENPEAYGLDNSDTENLQLSEPVIPYKYNSNSKLVSLADTKYYFICNDEEQPIASLVVIGDEEVIAPSVTFETSSAVELSNYLTSHNSFTLVYEEDGLVFTTSENNSTLINDNIEINIDDSTSDEANSSSLESSKLFASSTPSSYGLSIPIKSQGSNGLCWAACVASVGQYKTGTNKTAKQVANAMGIGYNSGATPSQTSAAVSSIYGLNSSVVGGYYQLLVDIYNLLSSDKVPIAYLYANYLDSNSDNDAAHAVVIQGYRASTQGAVLSIMDPNNTSYVLISNGTDAAGNETWALTGYSQGTFYWLDTVLVN